MQKKKNFLKTSVDKLKMTDAQNVNVIQATSPGWDNEDNQAQMEMNLFCKLFLLTICFPSFFFKEAKMLSLTDKLNVNLLYDK